MRVYPNGDPKRKPGSRVKQILAAQYAKKQKARRAAYLASLPAEE